MAKIIVENAADPGYTLLANDFIDNFMPEANPAFVLIYIYLLRNAAKDLDTGVIAETFSMLESDVLRAFKHWDKSGLIKYEQSEAAGIVITLGPSSKKAKAKKAVVIDTDRTISPANKPKYNPLELEMYKNDYREIGELFDFSVEALGKKVSDTELSTIYSFYDWLKLPVPLIKFLLEYCAENGHRRIKYIEAVAIDWAQNNIATVDEAKSHINIFNKDYRDIMSAMGLSGRNPATKELEFMDKWYKEWSLPLELILEGCAKTVIAVGKAQFAYADKILEGWFNASAKTIEDVKNLEAAHKEKTADRQNVGHNQTQREMPKRKSVMANYEQRVRDYDEIERLEHERLKRLNS